MIPACFWVILLSYEYKNYRKLYLEHWKKVTFLQIFFDFFSCFAKLLKYTSTSGDLLEKKFDGNDHADVHILLNSATFESNGR